MHTVCLICFCFIYIQFKILSNSIVTYSLISWLFRIVLIHFKCLWNSYISSDLITFWPKNMMLIMTKYHAHCFPTLLDHIRMNNRLEHFLTKKSIEHPACSEIIALCGGVFPGFRLKVYSFVLLKHVCQSPLGTPWALSISNSMEEFFYHSRRLCIGQLLFIGSWGSEYLVLKFIHNMEANLTVSSLLSF
jgi:hypothetical protein